MSRTRRAFALALTLSAGSAEAPAQPAGAPTELVAAWPDPILQWNAVMLATVAVRNAIEQQRLAAIAHLAMFEAVNAITGDYEPYLAPLAAAQDAAAGAKRPRASAEAAAIAAAHTVLLHYLTEQAATLDAARASSLSRVVDGPAKAAGIVIGEAAAAALIDRRLNDGSQMPEFHTPPSKDPGVWQLTGSCPPQGGLFLHLPNVVPFALERSDQFRAEPPPSLAGRRYAADFNEVKRVGAAHSRHRPADRADVARFYAAVLGLPTWNGAARQAAAAQKRSLSENARAFALLNAALFDATIAVFETKYHHAFWRPETAIPDADRDDNPGTAPNPGFTPFITTPCHPSYPSAHASLGYAARAVLERIYGKGPHAIELASPAVPDVRLRYTSFAEITDDIDDARIFGGIHFRFDQQAGGRQGRQVGTYILQHLLRPARHHRHENGAGAGGAAK